MKKILIAFLFCLLNLNLLAQDTPIPPEEPDTAKVWTYGGNSNFSFAQVGLRNWVGGGQSSVSINSIQLLYLNMERERVMWNNNLELGFGLIRQGRAKENVFRKSDDRLIFLSKVSRRIVDNWNINGLIDFRTQMYAGFEYRQVNGTEISTMISDFLAPGFLIKSIGWEYRKSDNLFFSLSPLTSKMTIVIHDGYAAEGRFGVEPGRNLRTEIGAFLNARFKREVYENITLDTRLNLFGNYENIQSIDVNWELLVLMKVNKYVTASFSTHLIYDDDILITREDDTIGPATQLRTVLNAGLIFKWEK
ncbi:MAG: DUF3078 domain-containing protein [Cytophagaceae bacterium]